MLAAPAALDIKVRKNQILTAVFYGSIGLISALALLLLFYFGLSLDSNIKIFIVSNEGKPVYLWSYIFLTLGVIILFGINVPLLVYRWRKYGFPQPAVGVSGGLGAVIGVFASACPVCGSTLLSLIGISGGLAAFPFRGLELKALSFIFLFIPLVMTVRQIRRFEAKIEACPVPRDPSFKKGDWIWLFVLAFILIGFFFTGLNIIKKEVSAWQTGAYCRDPRLRG